MPIVESADLSSFSVYGDLFSFSVTPYSRSVKEGSDDSRCFCHFPMLDSSLDAVAVSSPCL